MTGADIAPNEDGFPLLGYEVTRHLALHPFADVTVEIEGTLIDVCAVTYDTDRDKTVLKILPEDLKDATNRMTKS